jgi:hypothetical protein
MDIDNQDEDVFGMLALSARVQMHMGVAEDIANSLVDLYRRLMDIKKTQMDTTGRLSLGPVLHAVWALHTMDMPKYQAFCCKVPIPYHEPLADIGEERRRRSMEMNYREKHFFNINLSEPSLYMLVNPQCRQMPRGVQDAEITVVVEIDGGLLSLHARMSSIVHDIKRMISDATGIRVERMDMLCNGVTMEDRALLYIFDISDGIVLRPKADPAFQ